jgi:hypothetical protein
LTGDLTKGQLQAIQMVAIARFAGEHNHCPRYHVIEDALLRELADAGVTPQMLDTEEYTNAVVLGVLGPMEKYDKNPSDFCAATWQLLGPKGLYKRQMLEAN